MKIEQSDFKNISRVNSLSEVAVVNRMLDSGWVLLTVIQRTLDDESWAEYIIGESHTPV